MFIFQFQYESLSVLPRFQEYLLTDMEKTVLQEFVRILKPYMEAIASSEMDDNLCSEMIPKYSHLNEFISEENQRKQIVQVVKKQTQDRYRDLMENDVALLAVFLDPRFSYIDDLLIGKKWVEVEQIAEQYCGNTRFY